MPLRIGLTGGIGSGKSTVATLLQGFGARLVDTDAIARELTLPGGAAIEPIRTLFGEAFIDATTGALDRARMRAHAFATPDARARLESILHPLIGDEARRRADGATSTVVFDVPLLVESRHWRARVDRVLVVDCPESTQVDRVVARSGWTRDAVQTVIAQQATRAQRRACADAVVFNDGITRDRLEAQLRSLWDHWGA